MKSVLDVYSGIMKANPTWTAKEEADFIEKWWSKDREYFVNEAMKHNLGIVFDEIQKIPYNKNDLEDVFQKGVTALVQSLRKFRPDVGYRISTWVLRPVRWAVMQYHNPYKHQGLILDEINGYNYRYGTNLRVSSTDESMTGTHGEDIETIGNSISQDTVDSDYFTMRGMKTSDDSAREMDFKNGVAEMLDYMSSRLSEKEMYVVKRMLEGKNMTEISVELNLCRMRISQISAKAFEKIRKCKISEKLKELFKT